MEAEVISYIKEAKNHGLSEQEIKQNLLNAGWEAPVVEQNFSYFKALENKPFSNKDEDIKFPAEKAEPAPITRDALPAAEHLPALVAGQEFQKASLKFRKRPAVWAAAGLIILIVAGSYWFYTYGFYILVNSPSKVWEKFITIQQDKIYQNDFSLSYSDQGSLDNTADFIPGLQIKDIKLSFAGQSYQNLSDANNPQASSDIQYSFGSGDSNFSTGFKYRLANNLLYINLGDNPFLNGIIKNLANGQSVAWLKLDLSQDGNLSPEEQKYQDLFKQIFDSGFKAELSALWHNSRFIKLEKTLGREQMGGVNVFHLKLSLDKQTLKSLVHESIAKTVQQLHDKGGPNYKDLAASDDQMKLADTMVSGLVDKLEIKQFEAWIGAKDFKLYRILFVSNGPSVISFIKAATQNISIISNDTKRLADIRQLASALELYYNDNSKYPPANTGIPQGLTPTYIGLIPAPPLPPGNNCNDYYNAYWYKVDKARQHYTYTFCLSKDTSGYKAGVNRLTSSGVEYCPDTKDKCGMTPENSPPLSQNQTATTSPVQQINDFMDKLQYSAEVKADMSYSNYGKVQKVDVPSNAFDLMQGLKGSVQGAFIKALGN